MRFIIFATVLMSILKAGALINGVPLKGASDVVRIKLSNGWVCTGTYIDPYTILTAAHCLLDDENTFVLETTKIESESDSILNVKATKFIPNKNYSAQYWPSYDVGIIKTTENKKFKGEFKLQEKLDGFIHKAALFGCGKIEYDKKTYVRTTGENTVFKLGGVLFFLGESGNDKAQPGAKVSVAPNDSGGPIVNFTSGKIIGVMTTTTLKDSINFRIPTLSTGTSTVDEENLKFIQDSMGYEIH